MGQPRCNQLTKITPEWKRRQRKSNASLRCQLLRRKVHASVTTTDGDTHALPYAVRSADKIQARPTKHNARLGCRLLRLQTKLGASSNKNSDARVDVPAAKCSCSDRITEDNCNQTAACQPSLCKEYRFVGGGLAPASTSPSQSTDSNSASLPVCILCLRDAPDYAPFWVSNNVFGKVRKLQANKLQSMRKLGRRKVLLQVVL